MEKAEIILETTQGNIGFVLFPEVAPKACENFRVLSKNAYYDGLVFHRVIKDFMIQGGDPTASGMGGESIWKTPFVDEFDTELTFDQAGCLAMANCGPNTNGSQFFITTVPTPWLHMRHTIFGKIVHGHDTVKKIELVKCDSSDRPLIEQKIIRVRVVE